MYHIYVHVECMCAPDAAWDIWQQCDVSDIYMCTSSACVLVCVFVSCIKFVCCLLFFPQVAISRFEPDHYLPYSRLQSNLEVVKSR